MLKRILGLLGWLGVALVFAAVAIKFSKPEWQQVLLRPGHRRTGLHAALHPQPVAGDRPSLRRTSSPARHPRRRQRLRRPRHSRGAELSRHAPQQAVGPDRRQAVLAVRPDAEGPAGSQAAGPRSGCSRAVTTSSASATGWTNTPTRRSRCRSISGPRKETGAGAAIRRHVAAARWSSTTRGETRRRRRTGSRSSPTR